MVPRFISLLLFLLLALPSSRAPAAKIKKPTMKEWTKESPFNPEEVGDLYEGDIREPPVLDVQHEGTTDVNKRWPDATVPYVIRGNFSQPDLDMIDSAMQEYMTKTCIRFVERADQPDYLEIWNKPEGCYSYIGKIGGPQTVNLQSPSCTTKVGTPIHELNHAVGFFHEQSRSDREKFVRIIWTNIRAGMDRNFVSVGNTEPNDYGVPYDYGSVMHYTNVAFSANGQPTIEPKEKGVEIGQRDRMSESDAIEVNRMYGCPDIPEPSYYNYQY